MPFLNSNTARGLPANGKVQVGRTDVDSSAPGTIERGLLLPWPSDPDAGWVYYECTVGVMLDSGMVIHNRLPQVDNAPDTLASCDFDDSNLAGLGDIGVNLRSRDQYTDIMQRMGHSRYWFRLWGQALRVGKKVPIPSLKTIGGVPAVPYDRNPQWAFNRIAPGGNYGGIVLWHAVWSLWYTTLIPPRSDTIPASDPSAHIRGDVRQPAGLQAPFSQPDDNAIETAPPNNANFNNARPI